MYFDKFVSFFDSGTKKGTQEEDDEYYESDFSHYIEDSEVQCEEAVNLQVSENEKIENIKGDEKFQENVRNVDLNLSQDIEISPN